MSASRIACRCCSAGVPLLPHVLVVSVVQGEQSWLMRGCGGGVAESGRGEPVGTRNRAVVSVRNELWM